MRRSSAPVERNQQSRPELSVLVSAVHRRAAALAAADIEAVVADVAPWLDAADVARVVAAVESRLRGLGEIEALLDLPDVTDVLINGPGPVFVERGGTVAPSNITLDADGVRLLVDRISAVTRKHLDERSSLLEATLPAGHRVTVVVAPVAVDGPHIAIRRFRRDLDGLASFVMHEPHTRDRLVAAVEHRQSLLIVGPTGAGKTTLMSALLDLVGPDQRIVVIEDTREVTTWHPNVAVLTTQRDVVRRIEIDLDQLVRTSLRLRPDRIVVGEIRGVEALDLVHALTTGHRGGMATMHASSMSSAMRRLRLLCGARSAADASAEVLVDQLRSAFDLVVTLSRLPDGRRAVVAVEQPGDAE